MFFRRLICISWFVKSKSIYSKCYFDAIFNLTFWILLSFGRFVFGTVGLYQRDTLTSKPTKMDMNPKSAFKSQDSYRKMKLYGHFWPLQKLLNHQIFLVLEFFVASFSGVQSNQRSKHDVFNNFALFFSFCSSFSPACVEIKLTHPTEINRCDCIKR